MSNSDNHLGHGVPINDPFYRRVGWADSNGNGNLNNAYISVESQLNHINQNIGQIHSINTHLQSSFDFEDFLADKQTDLHSSIFADSRLLKSISAKENLQILNWESQHTVIHDFKGFLELLD